MPATAAQSDPHTMRCMEVWGGNQAVDNGVVMAGLDAWLYSRPYKGEAAGGDIHYVSSCAAGMVTRVLVADVSGHGEAVSEAAGKLRSLMRRYVNYVDQTRFVQGLNAEFSGLNEVGGFATAVVCTYAAMTDDFTLSNAGHPRPLWYRARSKQWSLMADPKGAPGGSPSNIPLGIAAPSTYDQVGVKLTQGDLVVLYTDSLIEATGTDGRMLGQEGLLRIAQGLDPSDPSDFLRGMLDAMSQAGAKPSADDVTVLILRPNGLKPRVSLGMQARMMGRVLKVFFASMLPGGPEFPAPETGPFAVLGNWVNRAYGRGSAESHARASTSQVAR